MLTLRLKVTPRNSQLPLEIAVRGIIGYIFYTFVSVRLIILTCSILALQCTRREVLSDIQTVLEPDRGMILIPEGSFMMGSDEYQNSRPVHEVFLSAYYISQNLVTNKEYYEFWKAEDGGKSSLHTPPRVGYYDWPDLAIYKSDHPVVGVSWTEAQIYTIWKSARTGKRYRLPTEAEWEKAARGTDQRIYPWGNDLPDKDNKYRANFSQQSSSLDGFSLTSPVTYFNGININTADGKSPYGLYDMAGNVCEWVADYYSSTYYRNSPRVNPKGPLLGADMKCLRGGSWDDDASRIKSYYRPWEWSYAKKTTIGFRVAMDAE